MFKNVFVFALVATALIYGCKKESDPQPNSGNTSANSSYSGSGGGFSLRGTDAHFSASIAVDSANRMIQSYLYSINYPANDSGLRSLSFSADSLRAYLSDPAITDVKFMFAHQPGYMNSGHFGQFAGMNPAALTVVIVGVSDDSKFILNKHQEVFEHLSPCPVYCDGITSPYISQ